MEMYNSERDRTAKVSSTSIIEELGQVDYIFSDKTGTLTRNVMEFKLLHVGMEIYGDPKDLEVQIGYQDENQKRQVTHMDTNTGMEYAFRSDKLDKILKNQDFQEINYEVKSSKGTIKLNYKTQRDLVVEFFKVLSLAHECVPETVNGKTFYQGPSPDEVTLVDFAKF
jgi:P-type E1-E2 ATPase